jgi:hypothetical protein
MLLLSSSIAFQNKPNQKNIYKQTHTHTHTDNLELLY